MTDWKAHIAVDPDILVGKPRRLFDANRLGFLGAQVLGRDVKDPVGVDIERHLNLRNAPRRRRNSLQIELSQKPVIGGHFPLALVDLYGDR